MNRPVQAAFPLLVVLGGALATVLTWGCNTDKQSSATPTVPTPPTHTALVVQGEFTDLPSSQGGKVDVVSATKAVPFTSTVSSSPLPDLQAQVNWTFPNDNIAVAFYPEGCTSQQFGVGACAPLVQGTPPSGSSAENVVVLSFAKPGKYVLGIQNLGPHAESGAYQVVVTYTGASS
jgi:hypothetical protein